MEQLTLTTPALLFSAISLIMLAYTNRFLAYAAVIRNLHDIYLQKKQTSLLRQIKNLKFCLLYTSPSPRDVEESRMPSSA